MCYFLPCRISLQQFNGRADNVGSGVLDPKEWDQEVRIRIILLLYCVYTPLYIILLITNIIFKSYHIHSKPMNALCPFWKQLSK